MKKPFLQKFGILCTIALSACSNATQDGPSGPSAGGASRSICDMGPTPPGTAAFSESFLRAGMTDLAVDAQGAIVVVGYYDNGADLGAGPLPPLPEEATGNFIAKFDCTGRALWSRTIPGSPPQGVAVDDAGRIAVVGAFYANTDFGDGVVHPYLGNSDAYLVLLEPDGKTLWSKALSTPTYEFVSDVATSGGRFYITGSMGGPTDFGGGPLSSVELEDLYVAAFDRDGEHLWSTSFPGPLDQRAFSIAANKAGEVAITGSYRGSLAIGADAYSSPDNHFHFFVAKLDASGAPRFSYAASGGSFQEGKSVAIDDAGDVLAGGEFGESMTIGGVHHDFALGGHGFAVRLDSGGKLVWSRVFHTLEDNPNFATMAITGAVALDEAGNAFVGGIFLGTLDLGNGPQASFNNGHDAFLAKYSAAGDLVWKMTTNAFSDEAVTDLAVGPSGALIVGGMVSPDVARMWLARFGQ
jgi:hypothetical protein